MGIVFLFFCALSGALVAAYIGYRCRYSETGEIIYYELYALLISTVLTTLICLGPLNSGSFDGEDSFVNTVVIIGLFAIVLLYYKILVCCSIWGEELNYPASVRRERYRNRHHKRTIVTTEAIARALRRAEAQEYEQELELMADLADGLDWVDLNTDSKKSA